MVYPSRHLDAVIVSLSSLPADPAYEAINCHIPLPRL